MIVYHKNHLATFTGSHTYVGAMEPRQTVNGSGGVVASSDGDITEITTTSTITDILGIIGSVVLMLMGVN